MVSLVPGVGDHSSFVRTHRLQKTYGKHLARLRGTGEGVNGVSENGAVLNECPVPVDGPDGMTSEHAMNLWGECTLATQIASGLIYHIAGEIHKGFPWFGELHRILSSRPNIIPPAIVTGIGPAGRETIYNNPPPPSQRSNPNINPALYTLGHDGPAHTPPPSQPHTSAHSQQSVPSQVLTPLFVQPGISSQPSLTSRSTTPVSLPPSKQEATPSLPRSNFAVAMAKAKENVKIRPHK